MPDAPKQRTCFGFRSSCTAGFTLQASHGKGQGGMYDAAARSHNKVRYNHNPVLAHTRPLNSINEAKEYGKWTHTTVLKRLEDCCGYMQQLDHQRLQQLQHREDSMHPTLLVETHTASTDTHTALHSGTAQHSTRQHRPLQVKAQHSKERCVLSSEGASGNGCPSCLQSAM